VIDTYIYVASRNPFVSQVSSHKKGLLCNECVDFESQSLRKSGQFSSLNGASLNGASLKSQSLRKSGQFSST